MTFNNNKFCILPNWRRALFLRPGETLDSKTLEYYLVELDGPNSTPISMLKAWVGVVLLAEDDWFYSSPIPSSAPSARASQPKWKNAVKEYNMQSANGTVNASASPLTSASVALTSALLAVEPAVV